MPRCLEWFTILLAAVLAAAVLFSLPQPSAGELDAARRILGVW